ncbi:hypothetical protein [Liquorilactobacillus hordei]
MQREYKEIEEALKISSEILKIAESKKWSPVTFEFALQMLQVTKGRVV